MRKSEPAVIMLGEEIERSQRAGLKGEPELGDEFPFVPIGNVDPVLNDLDEEQKGRNRGHHGGQPRWWFCSGDHLRRGERM